MNILEEYYKILTSLDTLIAKKVSETKDKRGAKLC